jgi:hypothetical protein
MGGVFISYRRQDAAGYAGVLHRFLVRRYDEARVFFDLATIDAGMDFSTSMRQAVSSSDVMLVVIGPDWLEATDAGGRPRIHDPDDFIHYEIAAALRQGKPVVPVLVGGADMPPAEALPQDLRGLALRQAVELRDQDFEQGLSQLSRFLDPLLGVPVSPASPAVLRPAEPALSGRPAPMSFRARLALAFDVLAGRTTNPDASAAPEPSLPVRSDSSITEPIVRPPALHRHEVFISYSSKDNAFADELVRSLEARGRICWIAPRDIPPGVPSWAEPIVMAIASSRLVLVLLTKNSIPSVDVMREVTLAADEKIPLLPVSLDTAPLSPALRYYFVAGQRLDLARFESEEQLRSVLPAVEKQLLARP